MTASDGQRDSNASLVVLLVVGLLAVAQCQEPQPTRAHVAKDACTPLYPTTIGGTMIIGCRPDEGSP